MTRKSRTVALGGFAALFAVVTAVLTVVPDSVQTAATAAGTVLAAAAAAVAAYESRQSASASTTAALTATRAFALHRQTEVQLFLAPDRGEDDADWVWIVNAPELMGAGHPVIVDLELEWIVRGQMRRMKHARLDADAREYWIMSAGLGSGITEEQLQRELSGVRLTWWDKERIGQWELAITHRAPVSSAYLVIPQDNELGKSWRPNSPVSHFRHTEPRLVYP